MKWNIKFNIFKGFLILTECGKLGTFGGKIRQICSAVSKNSVKNILPRRMHSVDSGWSWVICAVAFVSHTLTGGFSFATGVYYVEFLNVFNESKGKTALISSINLSAQLGIGKLNIQN